MNNKHRIYRNKSRIIDNIESFGVLKESRQADDPFAEAGIKDYVEPPYNMADLAFFYEHNTWHYRCCNIKARSVCGLGTRIVATDGVDIDKNNNNYIRLKEFLDRPNDIGQTLGQILHKFWIDYEAFGNAYLEIDFNFKGEIANIYHVPAYTVRVKKDGSGYYQMRENHTNAVEFNDFFNKNKKYELNSLAHLKSYYPKSDYYGIPDFLPALHAMVLDINASEFNTSFFSNSAIPAMAIVVEGGKLSEGAKNVIKSFFSNQVKGADNAHKTLFVPIDSPNVKVRFERLMWDVKDGSFGKLRADNRDEVISAHGVPPRMVGVMTAGQLGGSGEAWAQMKQFRELLINPRQDELESFLYRLTSIGLGVKDYKIVFNDIEIDDPLSIANRVVSLVQSGVLLPNEGREELGYDAIDSNLLNNSHQRPITNTDDLVKVLNSINEYIEREL